MQWDRPAGPGLGLTPFKTVGNRWLASEVERVARIVAHAKYHSARGEPIRIFHPDVVPAPGAREPFRRPIGVAMEMAILLPHYRQVLFERADFPSPLYGKLNPGSMFQGSQFTHCCIVTRGVPRERFAFYDGVLGLAKSGDFDLPHAEIGSSGKDIFQLLPDEGFHMHRFDDPRGGDGPMKRSGRLIFFNFRDEVAMPDLRAASRPGALGPTLYTLRVRDLAQVRERAQHAGATAVSEVRRNEFGERAVVLDAPDGTPWMLVDAADSIPLRD
jgi:catechol 2,3-dioxygenase-like lactoylglutathione lyase family enzyme